VYCYDGTQRYEQFLQVGRLYWALILLGSALLSFEHFCVCLVLYLCSIFWVTSLSLPFSELSLVGLAFDLVD